MIFWIVLGILTSKTASKNLLKKLTTISLASSWLKTHEACVKKSYQLSWSACCNGDWCVTWVCPDKCFDKIGLKPMQGILRHCTEHSYHGFTQWWYNSCKESWDIALSTLTTNSPSDDTCQCLEILLLRDEARSVSYDICVSMLTWFHAYVHVPDLT